MGLSPACGLPAFTNMVLSLEEGHGLNVTNECCWASKEDVCGDDRVRVVSVISISIYYPYLLSVRVDGSGVNPQASICFKRFGQDTFAEKKAVDCLAADDLAIFRSVDRRRGSPQVDRLVARCSVACNSRSSRPPNLLASCPLQAVS